MILSLPALVLAGGLVHRPTREALPAREIERPLVLPSGWSELVGGVGVGGLPGADLSGRMSLGADAELRVGVPWRGPGLDLGGVMVGGGLRLHRREAPARSLALVGEWTTPQGPAGWGPEGHRLLARLEGRRQWGGLRVDGAAGGGRDPLGGATALALARGALQAGPLGALGSVEVRLDQFGWAHGTELGGFVQLNRALQVRMLRAGVPRAWDARPTHTVTVAWAL